MNHTHENTISMPIKATFTTYNMFKKLMKSVPMLNHESLKDYNNKKVLIIECVGVGSGYVLQNLPSDIEYIFINEFMTSTPYFKYMFEGFHIDENEKNYSGYVFDLPVTVKKIYINNVNEVDKAYIENLFRLPFDCDLVFNPIDYVQLAFNRYVKRALKNKENLTDDDSDTRLYKYYSEYYKDELYIYDRAKNYSYIEEINITSKILFPDIVYDDDRTPDVLFIIYDRIDVDKPKRLFVDFEFSSCIFMQTTDDTFQYSNYTDVLKRLQKKWFK